MRLRRIQLLRKFFVLVVYSTWRVSCAGIALCVLSQNSFEEIPPQYILSRWRKDIHRSYILDYGCNLIDTKNPVHRYDNLYKCAVKLVEEGRKSRERCKFTLEALGEILNKFSLQDHNTL